TQVVESHGDSLDPTGHLAVRAPLRLNPDLQRPARMTVEALVTDVNRQSVYAAAGTVVHPSAFYLAVKPRAMSYFWSTGASQTIEVIAVRPTGDRIGDVAVKGALIRREWHQVRRENDGYAETVGEWVADTVDRCAVTVPASGATCRFTPPSPGS